MPAPSVPRDAGPLGRSLGTLYAGMGKLALQFLETKSGVEDLPSLAITPTGCRWENNPDGEHALSAHEALMWSAGFRAMYHPSADAGALQAKIILHFSNHGGGIPFLYRLYLYLNKRLAWDSAMPQTATIDPQSRQAMMCLFFAHPTEQPS